MDQSMSLLSAQVHFLDIELALIHIPLDLYSFFVEPIIQLLLPKYSAQGGAGTSQSNSLQPWAYGQPFITVSITPIECSIACSRALANELFRPVIASLGHLARDKVIISNEDYNVIEVGGEGLDAAQRVMDFTSPLAMNGISIFFITTYFADYILVPLRLRSTVISALGELGFVFEEYVQAFVNMSSPLMTSSWHNHSRDTPGSEPSLKSSYPLDKTSSWSTEDGRPTSTSPPSSISELQNRTFSLLAHRGIYPTVDPSIRLVQCAGRKDPPRSSSIKNGQIPNSHPPSLIKELHLGFVRCLVCNPRPKFFSVTLTDSEPASILIERRLLSEFEDPNGPQDDEIILGDKQDILVPITLDLRELPMESTGIVCGVAGRLAGLNSAQSGDGATGAWVNGTNNAPRSSNGGGHIVLSYLSTAKAGTVLIPETDLEMAMEALKFET